MKVLVTGSTGFVGSHLCDKLCAEGHLVWAQARNKKKFNDFQVSGKLVEGNLDDLSWIDALPKDLEAVIYTVGVVHSYQNDYFYQANSETFKNFIEKLATKYSTLRLVLISSLAASGPSLLDHPLDENMPCRPVSHYGHSKLKAEKYLMALLPEKWQAVILRPPMVIGPRDPAVLDIFKMVRSRLIPFPGLNGLNARYSYVGVFDLVEICHRCLTVPVKRVKIFFTSFPKMANFMQIVEEVSTLQRVKFKLYLPIPRFLLFAAAYLLKLLNKFFKLNARLTPDKYNELSQDAWTCSSLKSLTELKYDYQWDLGQILEKTYIDYKERQWI